MRFYDIYITGPRFITIDPQLQGNISFILLVLGFISIAWAVLIFFVVLFQIKNKERWGLNAISLSLLSWFLLDTIFTLTFVSIINVIRTIILLLILLISILFLKSINIKEE